MGKYQPKYNITWIVEPTDNPTPEQLAAGERFWDSLIYPILEKEASIEKNSIESIKVDLNHH